MRTAEICERLPTEHFITVRSSMLLMLLNVENVLVQSIRAKLILGVFVVGHVTSTLAPAYGTVAFSNIVKTAEPLFKRASEYAPEFPEPHFALAQLMQRSNRQAEAQHHMSLVNQVVPQRPAGELLEASNRTTVSHILYFLLGKRPPEVLIPLLVQRY